ncbi:MAG: NAD(P)-dependent alcohol dehydrogenase [Acidobacteriota bacterium]
MKAMVYREYWPPEDVLKLEDIEKPEPKDDEVLLRVHAGSVNPLDSHIMTTIVGKLMNLREPKDKVPGRDVSGVIEAVGKKVTRFKPGDEVFGCCGRAFAEYACASESKLAAKPGNVTHQQAASMPIAGLTALQAFRDAAKLQTGQTVLINGASGGVGTFAVQIAAAMFGADVTAVCSTRNVEMVRSRGANSVIDYTLEDFTQTGETYDVIFDLVAELPLSAYRRALVPEGVYVGAGMLGKPLSVTAIAGAMLRTYATRPFITQKVPSFMAKVEPKDLAILADLVSTGKITPVIDRTYQLTDTADAIRYVREKHAKGKVVITFEI